MMGLSVPLPQKALAAAWLGWSGAGLFYSLIMLHWVEFAGSDLSLIAPLPEGCGLRGTNYFLSSLDQLGDLKQTFVDPQASILCACPMSHIKMKAELDIEVLLGHAACRG